MHGARGTRFVSSPAWPWPTCWISSSRRRVPVHASTIRASRTQSALDSVTLPICKRTPRSWNLAVFATRLEMEKQGKLQPVFNWRIAFCCTPACLGVILGQQPPGRPQHVRVALDSTSGQRLDQTKQRSEHTASIFYMTRAVNLPLSAFWVFSSSACHLHARTEPLDETALVQPSPMGLHMSQTCTRTMWHNMAVH
jgi:hypothetical protein